MTLTKEEELEFIPQERRLDVLVNAQKTICETKEKKGRIVFVTFATKFDKKVVEITLDEEDPLSQLYKTAQEIFPYFSWRFCLDEPTNLIEGLSNKRRVFGSIKQSRFYNFLYLVITLLPTYHPFDCDECKAECNWNNRYKCTICADYDLCRQCEAKNLHANHAMLRILSSDTELPKYMYMSSPSFVSEHCSK
ncbi:ZZ-type domain-containing protein [Caenorhabditis elegans]|uniref:ZZ-type domain-containing protein n=1 Tax=Caenorhabditis elegans TaxID=6239 RepID=A0A168H2N7_CAEEL|nr:ZZ-type domain-containing protein [Caenorhabditis elegans]SAP35539.1 ZZ-type domain-containing protein [Caenorhabditis elegans]|eukprot:NP_497158.3 SeQueSTosome related [Caenorhabditis elegans]